MRILVLLPFLLLSVLVFREELEAPAPSSADGDVIAGRYIVLLEPGADPGQAAQDFDVEVRGLYRSAVRGFSAEMTALRYDYRNLPRHRPAGAVRGGQHQQRRAGA